jgi:hypothetical protein
MADYNQSFQAKPRKKTALDNKKLTLNAPFPTSQVKRSALMWGVHANNPRITVYTGDPEDSGERTGYGKIVANLDITTFYAFLEMLENIAKKTEECKEKFDNKGFTWFGGKRSEQPVVLNSLLAGKDADGGIWISVIADNRPKIKFYIMPSELTSLYHGDGRPYAKGEAASLFALGYCQILKNLVSIVLVNEYIEEAPKKPYTPGGGNNNQGGGGYNKPIQQESYQNEIPF